MLFLLQLSQLNLSWLEQALSYAGFAGLHTLSLGYDYNKIIFQIQPIYNLSMCYYYYYYICYQCVYYYYYICLTASFPGITWVS